jgi:hypothetical protein
MNIASDTVMADATRPVRDHRGSPVPTPAMIATKFLELRRRRGLMITLIVVTVGIPSAFLAVRLLLHVVAPHTYGPAGGYDIYTQMTAGVLYTFGFIVAAMLGCTAGSADLSDGMFRHLVITGRSRLALYLARIPAGLAIILPLVAIGFAVICTVCVFAAPRTIDYNGLQLPAGLSEPQLQSWAADHETEVICDLPSDTQPRIAIPSCFGASDITTPVIIDGSGTPVPASKAQVDAAVAQIAEHNYANYSAQFLYPSNSLMVKTGLWLELESIIGFIVGLGLGSLLGQRTVSTVLMIVLEIVLTPIIIRAQIPHLINAQRAIIGVATARLEPGQLPLALAGGGNDFRVTESTATAICVVLAWLIGWTALGAWRMNTRDT